MHKITDVVSVKYIYVKARGQCAVCKNNRVGLCVVFVCKGTRALRNVYKITDVVSV